MPKNRKPRSPIPRSKIRSALRRLWLWSPERREALKAAWVVGTKRPMLYGCQACKRSHSLKAVQVDHITPAGSLDDAEAFIGRLFVTVDKLQVLCEACHKAKTHKPKN